MKHIKLFENFDTNSIDEICKKYKIRNYTINDDGSIDVDGDVHLSNRQISKLPLKFGRVSGNFVCNYNIMKSLEGCPSYVGGEFACSNNNLNDLKYSPGYVGGKFDCSSNTLTTLDGSPKYVGKYFNCSYNNELTSLEHSPEYIEGGFNCGNCKNLKTLIGFKTQHFKFFLSDYFLYLIYDIFKDNMEYINNFYDYHIITNLDNKNPSLNLKRFNKFLDLYDMNELTEEYLRELKKFYKFI